MRGSRKFAPLPPGVVKVRFQGESAPDLAAKLTALPGVSVVTGPDEYPGGRIYVTVALAGEEQARGDACTPACWTPVDCPACGNQLPPRGRSMPSEMGILDCCDEARMDPKTNPRHLWKEEEASA